MKMLFPLLLVWLMACSGNTPDPPSDSGLMIASPAFLVLAQRALTAQADADTAMLACLLAPNVRFCPPDTGANWQGRRAVLTGWQRWHDQHNISSIRLHKLTHLPVQTKEPLAFMDRAGVFVVCYATADIRYHNGRSRPLRLHVCYHFDAHKRIDYGWLSMNTQP